MNLFAITAAGTTIPLENYQLDAKLPSQKIGRHFSLNEPRFAKDIQDFGQLYVCIPLMAVLDALRDDVGLVKINSFNRTEEYQKELKSRGLRTASISPHVVKLAADIDTTSDEQTVEWVQSLRQVSKETGIPIRIGHKQYAIVGQTFIHLDVCPLYFAPGAVWHNRQHPSAWEIGGLEW